MRVYCSGRVIKVSQIVEGGSTIWHLAVYLAYPMHLIVIDHAAGRRKRSQERPPFVHIRAFLTPLCGLANERSKCVGKTYGGKHKRENVHKRI